MIGYVAEQMEYVENTNAPEFWADEVHDVEVIGHTYRFVMVQYRKNSAGIWYKETAHFCRLPSEAIGPGIALTVARGGTSLLPVIGSAARDFVAKLLH